MASLGAVLLTVLCINGMLFLGQVAVTDLNPAGPVFYNCQDSILGGFEANNCQNSTVYVLNDHSGNITEQLPTSAGTITVTSGNFFTDTFSAIAKWFSESTGLKYLYNLLAAPSNFLKALGLPSEMSFMIGAIWYGFTLIVIVAFYFGRDY